MTVIPSATRGFDLTSVGAKLLEQELEGWIRGLTDDWGEFRMRENQRSGVGRGHCDWLGLSTLKSEQAQYEETRSGDATLSLNTVLCDWTGLLRAGGRGEKYREIS